MKGYQLTFYTQQDRTHGGSSLAEWLLNCAREQGAMGGTLFTAESGFGHDRRLHSAHFFELADQPVCVVMAVDAEACERMLKTIRQAALDVFYVKVPIEYGRTGA
jgi:PII-like signaling protein